MRSASRTGSLLKEQRETVTRITQTGGCKIVVLLQETLKRCSNVLLLALERLLSGYNKKCWLGKPREIACSGGVKLLQRNRQPRVLLIRFHEDARADA